MNTSIEPVEQSLPFSPKNLINLFIRPSKFFSSNVNLHYKGFIWFLAWCYGFAGIVNEINEDFLRLEFGEASSRIDFLIPFINDWPGFWQFGLFMGVVGGLIRWWIGGWLFSLRVSWSGGKQENRTLARLIYIYASFIISVPILFQKLFQTLWYSNYEQAYNAEGFASLLLLALPVWRNIIEYKGVQSSFDVNRTKAILWFLVIPLVVYFIGICLLIILPLFSTPF